MDDEEEANKTCGCECESCVQGSHSDCTTGMCKYKAPDATEDTQGQ